MGGVVTPATEHQHILFFFFFFLGFSLQISTQTTWIVSFLRTSVFEAKNSCLARGLASFPVSLLARVLLTMTEFGDLSGIPPHEMSCCQTLV